MCQPIKKKTTKLDKGKRLLKDVKIIKGDVKKLVSDEGKHRHY